MRARTFASLRTLFLAAAGTACGASTSSGIDRGDYPLDVCTNGTLDELAGVTATPAVDYAELRSESDAVTTTAAPYVYAKAGTACATASNKDACTQALATLRSTAGWSLGGYGNEAPSHRYLVYTRGDEVGTVTSLAALAAFVAPVENVHDAALLATEDGYAIDCTSTNARQTSGGWEIIGRTGISCGEGTHIDENVVFVSTSGTLTVRSTVKIKDGDPHCAIGRRPEGFVATQSLHASRVGAYFAEIAVLEAASVYAFDRLARELEAHGAPSRLVDAARRSARDEIRHAASMKRLAARWDAVVEEPARRELPVRDLFAIALENAVEGCVRETFGALQATFQAERATDPEVARVLRGIAADETRHAALAWEIAGWLEPTFGDEERARIDRARNDAVRSLARDLATDPSDEVTAIAGAPRAADNARLMDAVASQLWG